MFGREGVVNQVLMATHLTQEPLEFLLYSKFSMMVALWFLFIVFMIGPIYFSMQRIDEDIMSAAAVYGAGPWRTFFQVVVPLTLPGLMAGSLFVVVLGLAEFFTERAIGGAQSPMLAGTHPAPDRRLPVGRCGGDRGHADPHHAGHRRR